MNSNETQGGIISCPLTDGFYTYILRCSDGTLYTGWTVNLQGRLEAHNRGTGSKYTRTRRPVRLEYYESFSNRHEAMSRECAIKKMSRTAKEQLLKGTKLAICQKKCYD